MIQTKTETQPQKPTPLPPADELGARFCHWFSHPYNWIHALREKQKPGKELEWLTETRYPLQPRNLWQQYQDPHKYKVIGLRFGSETRYCLLDIDRGSPYHPANNYSGFRDVLTALEEIGLIRPLLVRSSASEGIHVYYFLPTLVPTFALACAIKYAVEEAGLDLRSGELESFPNFKSYSKGTPTDYNGHRLPLQSDSYWLTDDGQILTDDLAQFLDAADVAAVHQDFAALQKALAAATKRPVLNYIPGNSSRAQEWKRHLEERIAEGWTGQGQTNELLKDFAVYGVVWEALSGDDLIDFIVATAEAAPGYNQYCDHQHQIYSRAADWSKAAERHYSPYRSFPRRDGRSYKENFNPVRQNKVVNFPNQHNIKTRELAAKRIQQAMAHLETTDTLPHYATARAAAIIATVKELTGRGISLATLHRPCHLSLWHPGQQKPPEPAQGAIFHPTPEVDILEKPPEPAQGAIFHPTPLYEGLAQSNCPIEAPPRASIEAGGQPLEFRGECEGGNLPSSTPTALATPANSTDSIAPATPANSTDSTAPATPAGDSPPEVWRLRGIRLAATKHAKKAVRVQAMIEGRLFDPEERERREAAAMMQFLWDSGEPAWMQEVKLWLAKDPSRKLDLSVPTGADSTSITHEPVTETS